MRLRSLCVIEFADNKCTETLVVGLERAPAFVGGVPEQILCDNPKTIFIERNAYAEGQSISRCTM
jgi:transposase